MIESIPNLLIIDTHQHLWDVTRFDIPWLKGAGPLAGSHVLADYEREAAGLNIAKTVYMEVDVAPADRVREAETILDLCRDANTPLAGAIIGGNPLDADFKTYVERFLSDPHFKGVRQVLHGGLERGTCLKPEWVQAMRFLGEHDRVFDLCMRPDELTDGAQLAQQCPHARFVLDHCGNPNIYADLHSPEQEHWRLGIAELSQLPNVACKISGIIAQTKPGDAPAALLAPFVRHCAQAFGHERIMFASDWPVCTLGASLRGWIETLQAIVQEWNAADKRKLFYDNAHRFYGLT